jgi:hypothetical protein
VEFFIWRNDFARVREPGDHMNIRNRTEPVITPIYTVITACLMPDAGLISQARNAFEFSADP